MNNLPDVPIASVMTLTPECAVVVMRAILRSECGCAILSPTVLTITVDSPSLMAASMRKGKYRIGTFGDVGVPEARRIADNLAAGVRWGGDPQAEKVEARIQRREEKQRAVNDRRAKPGVFLDEEPDLMAVEAVCSFPVSVIFPCYREKYREIFLIFWQDLPSFCRIQLFTDDFFSSQEQF